MQNNVEYSQKLFLHAIEKDVPIVYASSAATYGAGELGYSDEHEGVASLKPLNRYGYSKQRFDEWVLNLERPPGHWFGLKFFNVFGPNEEHKEEMRSLVHKACEQILENGSVKLFKSHRDDFEDGKQLRDFVYGKDVARAMIEMMNPEKADASGIYNMGSGHAHSFLELVRATFKAMERPEEIEFIDMPVHLRNQYQYYTQAEMAKFEQSFHDFEFTPLEKAVAETVQITLEKRG
jgi:ADP-L-glycero-D-manno-heptose 6-epimerase